MKKLYAVVVIGTNDSGKRFEDVFPMDKEEMSRLKKAIKNKPNFKLEISDYKGWSAREVLGELV